MGGTIRKKVRVKKQINQNKFTSLEMSAIGHDVSVADTGAISSLVQAFSTLFSAVGAETIFPC